MALLNTRLKPSLLPASQADATPLRNAKATAGQTAFPPLPSGLQPHVVYARTMGRLFGDVAIDLGLMTSSDVKDLLHLQSTNGGRIGELAIDAGLLTDENVKTVLGAQSLTVHVDARHASTPHFLTWINDLSRLGIAPQIKRVSAQDLQALRQEQIKDADNADADLETLNLARRIFIDGAAAGASDIVVLVREHHAEVQMRMKGDYKVAQTFSMRQEEGEALVRSIYTGLATVKAASYKPREFQDAQIHGDALPGTSLSSVRIIRGPCYPEEQGGSFMVARLQYRKQSSRTAAPSRALNFKTPQAPSGPFDVPGFTPLQKELVEHLVRLPMGIVIVTGPTGSGKTTTLFEFMKYQAQIAPESRQVTIEDPTEYPQPWAIQLAAGDKDFRDLLRMTLRMDPDIILLGEIRKADEAVAALQAAMTGHFVWTTLHVTDAYKSIPRMEMLDRERLSMQTLCDHELIVGMVAQRVVPELCPSCSIPILNTQGVVPNFMTSILKSWGDLSTVKVRGEGCPDCRHDGIVGRRAVAEIVLTTQEFMSDYLKYGVLRARRNHRMKEGSDKSMLANAMDLVFEGKADPRDVHKQVQKLELKGEGV